MTTTSHLGVTLVVQSQAQKEVTVNTALHVIDALLNTGAKDKDLATPPGSPAAGDVYIVAASPTGAWSGQAGKIAYYTQTWQFIMPNEGMTLWVNDEDALYTYNGSGWVASAGSAGITALTGDVTASGTGSVAATLASNAVTAGKIASSAVTYAKLQNASAATLLGNPTGSGAAPSEITLGAGLVFSGATLNAVAASPVFFGGGNDGNVTISSGTTNITRDMYYNNLTLSGTGKLNLNGWRVFVAGTLDLSAAPAAAIVAQHTTQSTNGANGTAIGGAGAAGFAASSFTVGNNVAGGAGGAGNTGAGTNGTAGAAVNPGAGGQGAAGGNGGAGVSGGGTGASAGAMSTTFSCYKFQDYLLRIAGASYMALACGGSGAGGGGGGGGDATNKGGGGGGGGASGAVIYVCANLIARGTNTTASLIRAAGGNGGNGGSTTLGNTGGGGAGGGGGGGWIYLCYGSLTGSAITNMLDASGGNGGNGGTGTGTGVSGAGGTGGSGGRVTVINVASNTVTETLGTTGSAPFGVTGGAGNSVKVTL